MLAICPQSWETNVEMCYKTNGDVIMATTINPTDVYQLFQAAATGNIEVVKQSIAKGVDISARDSKEWLPLDWALSRGHSDVALLLEKSVVDEGVFLITAAYHGNIDVVRKLLKRGVKVNATNSIGETALMYAALKGYKEVIELLLEHGADPNQRNSDGRTAHTYALALTPNGQNKFDDYGRNIIEPLLGT